MADTSEMLREPNSIASRPAKRRRFFSSSETNTRLIA
jgi:hypothetical protein